MGSVKNRFSFLLSEEGTYVLYDNGKPVVEQIVDPSISVTSTTDPNTEITTYRYSYYDERLYAYMRNLTDRLLTNTSRQKRATRQQQQVIEVDNTQPAAKQTNDQAANAAAQSAAQNAQLQTVRQGYGTVPNSNKVDSLTKNTGAYGGGIGSLVYPSDLITNQYGYNGCYTVFFISEHPGSSIGQLESFHTTSLNPTVEGGAIAQSSQGVSQELIQEAVTTGVSFAGGYAIAKRAASGIKKLASGSLDKNWMGVLGSLGSNVGGVLGGMAINDILEDNKKDISILQNNTNYQQLNVAIALPTPRIEDKHVLKWSAQDTTLGGGVLQMLQGSNNVNVERLFSMDGLDELKRVANLQNERGEKLSTAAAANVKGAVDALIMSQFGKNNGLLGGFGSTVGVLAGKRVNPRKEQLFDDVEFRTFTMSFDLAARSTKDMENIESIIRIFKYHAYPELTPGNWMWIYPAHFDIVHYYRNDVNTHMPRHATSVLTNIDVDYGGGQSFISVHHDGSPVMIKLTLSFTEIAVLNRDSIKKGY